MRLPNRYGYGIGAATLALVLLALLIVMAPTPAAAQYNTACYRPIGGAAFVCGNGGTMLIGAGASLTVEDGGAANISGLLAVTGTTNLIGNTSVEGTFAANGASLAVAKKFATTLQAALTITNGGTIAPTGTLQEITAASPVTAVLRAPTNGEMLILVNSGANAITIVDESGTALAGNAVLGQNDTLMLIGTTGSWYQIGGSNN